MRAVAVALVVALAGCGGEAADGGGEAAPPEPPAASPAPEGSLRLTIRRDDGRGEVRTATLGCDGAEERATGYLAGDADSACPAARRLRPLLTTQPDEGRICTQVFGGPQTARVRGTIDGSQVNRGFSRANGCEIADWDRAAPLLDAPAARS